MILLALLHINYVYSNNTAIWEAVKVPEIFFFWLLFVAYCFSESWSLSGGYYLLKIANLSDYCNKFRNDLEERHVRGKKKIIHI